MRKTTVAVGSFMMAVALLVACNAPLQQSIAQSVSVALGIGYDGAKSGIAAKDVQGAIDELSDRYSDTWLTTKLSGGHWLNDSRFIQLNDDGSYSCSVPALYFDAAVCDSPFSWNIDMGMLNLFYGDGKSFLQLPIFRAEDSRIILMKDGGFFLFHK